MLIKIRTPNLRSEGKEKDLTHLGYKDSMHARICLFVFSPSTTTKDKTCLTTNVSKTAIQLKLPANHACIPETQNIYELHMFKKQIDIACKMTSLTSN